MSLSGLEKAISELAADNRSSASVLVQKAVRIYMQYFENAAASDKNVFFAGLEKLNDALRAVQPSMVSIGNVVDVVSRQANGNRCLSLKEIRACQLKFLSGLKDELADVKNRVAQNALAYIPDAAVVITLSQSSTVEEVLRRGYLAKKISRVIVAESRPLCEGLSFAKRLLKLGIPVTVITDAALGFFCKDADLAIVGADTVQNDGSILHKVGTYPLALACHDHHIPFYVVCDTLKISKTAKGEHELIKTKPSKEIVDPESIVGADVQNIYFDITPSKYITRLITEKFG